MPILTVSEGTVPLSLPRKWIGDLLHFSRRIPSIPVQYMMELGPLVVARGTGGRKVSWPAIFLKGYSLVCCDFPQLRRSYLPMPYARIWQHASSSASVAVSRSFQGEEAVFFVKIHDMESRSLQELDEILREHREAPWDSIGSFRRMVRITRFPRLLRRMLWSLALNWNGRVRQKFFGTFGLSVYSSTGADSPHPLGPLTTLLSYGPISPSGSVMVRIIYDHRVMDGLLVANALRRLEERLCTTVLRELQPESNRLAA